MKDYKLYTRMIGTVIILAIISVGCAFNDTVKERTTNDEIGVVLDGIDAPDIVLKSAKEKVQKDFNIATEDFPNYGYTNWRIKSLDYNYTYEELDGMELVIYQINYEFLSESPDNIVVAGGMHITEDNWVMPSYPNSTYLIFQQEDDRLSFLESVVINDSYPGEQLFTDDLQRVLKQSKAD